MSCPKSLNILLGAGSVLNATEKGEVTEPNFGDIFMIYLLSQALGFSYKTYSTEFRENGDFLVGDYVLAERWLGISLYPHDIEDLTFAVSKADYVSNSWGFLRAFSTPVWIAFLLSVLLMTLATFLIFLGRVPLSTVLFYCSVTLAGMHCDWKPRSKAQRWVVLGWSVGITLLSLAFAAVLLSFLTVPGHEKGITNFQELHDLIKKGKATALKWEGDTTEKDFIESGSETLKVIGENIQKQNTVPRGHKSNFLKLIKPNVAVIGARFASGVYYGGHEHVISTDSVFMFMRVIYVMAENGFCWRDKMNAAIHRISGAGLYKKKKDDNKFISMLHFRSKFPDIYSRDENTIQPLSLLDMSGAFYLLLVGHILSLICFVCERVAEIRYRKIRAVPNRMRKIERKRN